MNDARLPFPTSPLYGRTDPETSSESAAKLRESGQLGADQALTLKLVRDHPGSTCPELALWLMKEEHSSHGFEHYRQKVGRRLSEVARTCRCEHSQMPDHRGGCLRCPCPAFSPAYIFPVGKREGCQIWWPVKNE